MATEKQRKAQDLNWLKAQVTSANAVTAKAVNELQKYGIVNPRFISYFNAAHIELTWALKYWDKIIWGKEGKK